MNTEPLPFLKDDLPSLFNRGVAALRERAEDDDEKAQARLADVEGAHGAIRIVLSHCAGGSLLQHVQGADGVRDGATWLRYMADAPRRREVTPGKCTPRSE